MSTTKASSWRPSATSPAAAARARESDLGSVPRSPLTRAPACLMRPRASMKTRGNRRPLTGKLATASRVWGPIGRRALAMDSSASAARDDEEPPGLRLHGGAQRHDQRLEDLEDG